MWSLKFLPTIICFRQKMTRISFMFGFTKLTAVSVFRFGSVYAIFHLRFYGMTLEITYFRAEFVQLIVSRSDSELVVQRYGMKKNTLTADPIMSEDELWTTWKTILKPPKSVFETELPKLSFWFLNYEVSSVRFLENRYPTFSSGSAHP